MLRIVIYDWVSTFFDKTVAFVTAAFLKTLMDKMELLVIVSKSNRHACAFVLRYFASRLANLAAYTLITKI